MTPVRYAISLGRRLALAILGSTKDFAKNETLAFGAVLAGLATTGALKVAEAAGITLNATALAFVAVTATSVAVVIIRQFVGSIAFVEAALADQEPQVTPTPNPGF